LADSQLHSATRRVTRIRVLGFRHDVLQPAPLRLTHSSARSGDLSTLRPCRRRRRRRRRSRYLRAPLATGCGPQRGVRPRQSGASRSATARPRTRAVGLRLGRGRPHGCTTRQVHPAHAAHARQRIHQPPFSLGWAALAVRPDIPGWYAASRGVLRALVRRRPDGGLHRRPASPRTDHVRFSAPHAVHTRQRQRRICLSGKVSTNQICHSYGS
jgi:hypothetical protein